MCLFYIVYVLELAGFGENLGPDRALGESKIKRHDDTAQGLPVVPRELGDRCTFFIRSYVCEEKVGAMIN